MQPGLTSVVTVNFDTGEHLAAGAGAVLASTAPVELLPGDFNVTDDIPPDPSGRRRPPAPPQHVPGVLAHGDLSATTFPEVLGWLKRGQIQKELEAAFTDLADGQVSRLVRAGPGLHLFKVEGRRRAGGKTFEEAKEEIREILVQEQTGSYRDQYLAELKKDAVIELRLAELRD